MQNGLIAVKC